jgi:hypothetical protein
MSSYPLSQNRLTSSAALASEEGGAVGSSIGATGEGDIATGGTGRGNGEELVDMALDL